ncbi:hypothetical protein EVAR_87958_1 [Eumeta japonica]|uniref:Pre-C2HC domain-containing protein n=1 Tax=Eumeta variegata TaxID=151549 RepID=A0A4C1VCN3_EUMVA|nr:hypothetical protein EVAR_87958_1 [Eumeta japonica]
MDDNRLKQFLKERGLLDLLRDFETYCSSPASPVQPDPDLEMEVENLTKKEPNKRPAAARPSEGSTSDSDTSGSDDSDHSDLTDSTEFTTVRRRKASRPKTAKSYLTQAGDGSSYYRITPSSKKPKKANSKSKPSTPVKSTQSIYDAPESWRKTIQPTKATAPTVTLHEADEIVLPAPAKPQRPPPLFIHDKGRWTEIKKQCDTKGIVILNGRNSIKGLKIQPESDEREFRFVLRRVPKEIPIEEVKEDLLTQDLPVQSVRRITNRAREPLDLVLVTANTGIDYETKRSFYRIKAVCSLSGCPRAPKRNTTQKNKTPPPPAQAAPRRAPARAVTQRLSYAKATAGPRTDPPPQSKINPTPSENIKALMSVISIIDIGEVVLLANKFKAAANPVEKNLDFSRTRPARRVAGYLSSVKIFTLPAQQSKKGASSSSAAADGETTRRKQPAAGGKLSSAQRRRRFIQNPIKWRNNRPSQCMSTTGVPMAL